MCQGGDVPLCRLNTSLKAVHRLCERRNRAFRIFDPRIEPADRLGQRGYRPFCVFNAGIKSTNSLRKGRKPSLYGFDFRLHLSVGGSELLSNTVYALRFRCQEVRHIISNLDTDGMRIKRIVAHAYNSRIRFNRKRVIYDAHLVSYGKRCTFEQLYLISLRFFSGIVGSAKPCHICSVHQGNAFQAAAMGPNVNRVSTVFQFASAGIRKPHQCRSAVQWAAVCKSAFHHRCRLYNTHGERRSGKQLCQSLQRRSFKHKGHKVVPFAVERVRNVFAGYGADLYPRCEAPLDPHNIVILTIIPNRHARQYRNAVFLQDSKVKGQRTVQFVAYGSGEHMRNGSNDLVIFENFNHIRAPPQTAPRLRT